jgi:NAD kinase
MPASIPPRAVLVSRPSEYQGLLARHGTSGQAEFFLARRGQSIEVYQARHRQLEDAIAAVSRAVPMSWRRARLLRADLPRAVFGPDDIIIAVGQDGLVANVAKYLDGQIVIGVDPDPSRNAGVLVRHPPEALGDLLLAAATGRARVEERTMVAADVDDGQKLVALNEIFIGHASHQSARYTLRVGGRTEQQSSSGLIVATGTGATGWACSIARERRAAPPRPAATEPGLVFFVREAWPSRATGVDITTGSLGPKDQITVRCEQELGGVVFGDGLEEDRIALSFGQEVSVAVSSKRLRLVT